MSSPVYNCYTPVCPPVQGDNPQALGSGLSPIELVGWLFLGLTAL